MTMRRRQGYHHGASNNSVLFFHFYCYPTRTVRRRRQCWPRTPPPPKRIVLSAAARPMTVSLFYFLLLPVDNKGDIEPRLSLYPAPPRFAHMTAWLFYFNWYCDPTTTTTRRFAMLHSYHTAPLTETVFIFYCYQKTTTVYYHAWSFISSILCLSLFWYHMLLLNILQ